MTALRMTVEVVLVSDKDEFESDGHKTDSTAKKQPATAALKPAERPAADPAARRGSILAVVKRGVEAIHLATELPISTLGPSGPRELPVPKVTEAAIAFKKGREVGLELERRLMRETTRPPKAGTSITLFHVSSIGASLNHEAPRSGIPSHNKSRISCT
jgi:hypothetical protein